MKTVRRLVITTSLAAAISCLSAATVTLDCPAYTFAKAYTLLPNVAVTNLPDILFTNAPLGMQVAQWNPTVQDFQVFAKIQFGPGLFTPWGVPMTELNGFFVNTPYDKTFTWTIPDEPPASPPPLNLESNKYYLRGPVFYGNSRYEDLAGAPPKDETSLYRYRTNGWPLFPPTPAAYQAYHFIDGAWSPSEPVLDPLEAAFIVYPTLRVKAAITGAPPVMVLTWPRGKLEVADQPNGLWQTVTNAQVPYLVDLDSTSRPSRFYRVREWP